jgi:hypothetical protein
MDTSGFAGIVWIGRSAWAFPALEVVHILGIALLVGNLVLVELRVWGLGRELPLQALGRAALPVSVAGFCLIVCSGSLMFAASPAELLASRVFTFKMLLVMCAGLNAAMFHVRGGLAKADAVARVQTALSLGLWLGVIILGRWIAYE